MGFSLFKRKACSASEVVKPIAPLGDPEKVGREEKKTRELAEAGKWDELGLLIRSGGKLAGEARKRFDEAAAEDVERAEKRKLLVLGGLVENVGTHEKGWSALAELARYATERVAVFAVTVAARTGDWNAVLYAGCYGTVAVAKFAVDKASEFGQEHVRRAIAAQYVTPTEIVVYARRKPAGNAPLPQTQGE